MARGALLCVLEAIARERVAWTRHTVDARLSPAYHCLVKTYTYRVIIEPDERNTFHAYVPALPGCHTWGETLEKARTNIRDALDAYVRSMIADGVDVPVGLS